MIDIQEGVSLHTALPSAKKHVLILSDLHPLSKLEVDLGQFTPLHLDRMRTLHGDCSVAPGQSRGTVTASHMEQGPSEL